MNINEVILGGRLSKDPDFKQANEISICNISIANNRQWRTKDGQKKEEVIFVACTLFGRTAENVYKFFRKGNPIVIKGRVSQDRFESKDGKKKEITKIVATDFWFVDSKSSAPSPATPTQNNQSKPREDDVPF